MNHANWSCLVTLQHPLSKPIDPYTGLSPTGEVLDSTPNLDSKRAYRVAIYQEEEGKAGEQPAAGPRRSATPAAAVGRNYSVVSKPIQIPSVKPDPKKPNPKFELAQELIPDFARFVSKLRAYKDMFNLIAQTKAYFSGLR
ncbi:unnamed protein product [Dibothriocephalus latus]|uniref:Uncharacterized protein n=1 Tax=Dibothriocephalus latus TaxID=60516 RepID=A0A3P7QTI2_DIBLA|nr:unnamed protein product [Dibothriocephalus latus]